MATEKPKTHTNPQQHPRVSRSNPMPVRTPPRVRNAGTKSPNVNKDAGKDLR